MLFLMKGNYRNLARHAHTKWDNTTESVGNVKATISYTPCISRRLETSQIARTVRRGYDHSMSVEHDYEAGFYDAMQKDHVPKEQRNPGV